MYGIKKKTGFFFKKMYGLYGFFSSKIVGLYGFLYGFFQKSFCHPANYQDLWWLFVEENPKLILETKTIASFIISRCRMWGPHLIFQNLSFNSALVFLFDKS